MDIGTTIKSKRNEFNMTQQQLAEKLNVSRTTISSWENNRTYPDLNMIVELSDEFNITLDHLLKGDEVIVKQITEDTKSSRIRKKWIFFLLGIIAMLIVLFGFYIFKNQNIRATQITNASTSTNNRVVVVELKQNIFYEYGGYMLDEPEKGIVNIEMHSNLNFSLKRKSTKKVKIPIENIGDKSKITQINIVNSNQDPIYTINDK